MTIRTAKPCHPEEHICFVHETDGDEGPMQFRKDPLAFGVYEALKCRDPSTRQSIREQMLRLRSG